MKKLLVFLLVAGICGLFPAQNMRGTEASADLKQEVIQLCLDNADLADQLNSRRDKEIAGMYYGPGTYIAYSFVDEQGRATERIPTSLFFFMMEDLIHRYTIIDSEMKEELERHQKLLKEAIKNGNRRPFVDERIR